MNTTHHRASRTLSPARRAIASLSSALLVSAALATPLSATPPQTMAARDEISVAPSASGNFVVTASVNGAPLALIVDTGASQVVLSYDDAVRAGLVLKARDFTQVAETANGATRFAPVTLAAITLGPVQRRNIPALVAEKGRLSSSLLGMTFLSQLSRVGTRDGVMVLSN